MGLTFLEPAFIHESLISKCLKYDEIQDPMPPNMGPWHSEYFKVKESEKWQGQEGLCPSPKAGHKTLRLQVPLTPILEERSIPFSAGGVMLEGI